MNGYSQWSHFLANIYNVRHEALDSRFLYVFWDHKVPIATENSSDMKKLNAKCTLLSKIWSAMLGQAYCIAYKVHPKY